MGIPKPEPGLVIQFSYLWAREWENGQREGRKSRPSVVILAVREVESGIYTVTVAPITTQPPTDLSVASEIPWRVKQHLGMDDKQSWVMLDEVNETEWPGYDLQPIPGTKDTYSYGVLPNKYLVQISNRIADIAEKQQLTVTQRADD